MITGPVALLLRASLRLYIAVDDAYHATLLMAMPLRLMIGR